MNGTQVVGNDTIADTTNGPSATTTLLGYMMAGFIAFGRGNDNTLPVASVHIIKPFRASVQTELCNRDPNQVQVHTRTN